MTVSATFLKPSCYVNLRQIFMFCCSFNGFEWLLFSLIKEHITIEFYLTRTIV